jgi:hypothetical protein
MSRDDFERDMREYISARKRARFNIKTFLQDILPKMPKKAQPMPEEVEVYTEKPIQEQPKESILTKWFKKETEELTCTKMEAEDTKTDLKEMARITLGMIKQLPDQQLKDIKQSSDFEKLKTILKKHDLIK